MMQLKEVSHYVNEKINVSSLKISEYITTDNMIPNRGGIVDCKNPPNANKVSKYETGDVLVSNIRPYFKKIWYATRAGGCSNDVIVFRSNTAKTNSKYLYYLLSQDEFFDYMMAGSNGTKMPRGNKKTIPDFFIPEHDLEIQQRIVDILSAYDNLIENDQKQIKLLEEAAQRLYKEWFVDLHFPGYEDTEIVGGVPEGWKKELVGNIIGTVSRSKQVKTSDYMPEGSIPIIDQSRDFVAGYTNDSETLVNMECPIIVFGDHTRVLKYIQFPFAKGADGTQLIVSNNVAMPQSLLYYSLIAADLSNYHYARHFKYLKAESILVPTEAIARNFNAFVSPILLEIQRRRDSSNKCEEARDRLLPKLMSGEIEV